MWVPTSARRLDETEKRVLDESVHGQGHVTYLRKPTAIVHRGEDHHIHTVTYSAGKPSDSPPPDSPASGSESTSSSSEGRASFPVVFCHGYGGGCGSFARVMAKMVRDHSHLTCHAIDWLGFGRSSRPSFRFDKDKPLDCAAEFVESLEAWRREKAIDKMVLCGHSMGGYLAAVYASRYPHRVHKLILASTVGIQKKPEELRDGFAGAPWYVRTLVGTVRGLWDMDVTPLALLRGIGPIGPGLLRGALSKRIGEHIYPNGEIQDYVYHVNANAASADTAITTLFEPTVFAREPLFDRVRQLPMPTLFLYGERDWVDASTGHQLKAMNPQTFDVQLLPDCAHQITVENSHSFAEAVGEFCCR
ncbi:unnamed protein product [Vitrella brassicaformis CCMP3155]|uniref:AB hydrolase-1 domain-containing protein n=2 Tax=Vitrella brassicaformis TaxID=1169539 RepID=A0A0G4EV60_VITBC|nr:unnamed protein product [Vitrella brassicaformis CCMP3155]|eukprot:CEM02227.1 unnamed protein product [Vitrella brassicaformis CCMP3155]